MIEIVYKEEKKEASGNEGLFHLPRNIRQIGECKGSRRIYMEDYAYTFLRQLEEKNHGNGKAGILLGRYNWLEGTSYLFIRSVLEIENMEVSSEHIRFNDKVWSGIHESMQQHFQNQEILGWFLSLPEHSMEINEVILRAHLNHFGGNDKVLFLIEPTEREEAFFSYDSGRLKRESGFYIYYEKNEAMQNYMIEKNANGPAEDQNTVSDQAVRNFRKLVEKKQEEKAAKSGHSLLYGVTACVAAASLVMALSYAGGLEGLQDIFSRFSVNSGQETEKPESVSVNGTSVQAVSEETQEEDMPDETDSQSTSPTPAAIPQSSESGENTSSNIVSASSASDAPESQETSSPEETQETAAGAEIEYTIRQGDTLTRICEEYYGSLRRLQDICAANGITKDDIIYPGQKIILPQ